MKTGTLGKLSRRRSSALLLLVILVVGCSPEPSGSPSAPPGSPPGPTATPVASPVAEPSLAPAAWTEAFSSELAILRDIVAVPPGLVAAGCRTDPSGNCVRALLLTSLDGASWTEVDLGEAAGATVGRVSRVGDRLFALGYRIDDQRGEIRTVGWTSLDGRSWSRISSASFKNLFINDVIDSPVGALAIGVNAPYAGEGFGFVVWDVEPDGSFGEPRDVHPTGGPAFVAGAAWTGGRFLAWGDGAYEGDNVRSTILMASSDGKAWKVLPKIPAFHGSSVVQLMAVGDRLVAVGYEGMFQPASPRAWTSVDGTTWKAAEVPSGAGAMDTVAVEGSRLVARGTEPSATEIRPVTWSSSDGQVWTRLPAGEDMPDLSGFDGPSRAMVDARACVAGTFYGDPTSPAPRAVIYCR